MNLAICPNDLLIRPNEEKFFFYLASLRRRIIQYTRIQSCIGIFKGYYQALIRIFFSKKGVRGEEGNGAKKF